MSETNLFLSYARDDREFAETLRGAVERLGVAVSEPVATASGGVEWARAVEATLGEADAVLLVVPESGRSGANNAYFEAGLARGLGKRVLGVVPPDRATDRVRAAPVDMLSTIVLGRSGEPVDQVARTLVGVLQSAA